MYMQNVNQKFQNMGTDYLYHFGIDSSMNLDEIFGNIQYVVFTRKDEDIDKLAEVFGKNWYGTKEDISFKAIFKTERFHLYKIGLVLLVSHGVGAPSMLICLNEIAKLLVHLRKTNAVWLNVAPAGGVGSVGIGDMVVVHTAFNGKLEANMQSVQCANEFIYPSTVVDIKLIEDILKFAQSQNKIKLLSGNSIGANDYYEEQARLDGFLPIATTIQDRDKFLIKAHELGVNSIDMDSVVFNGFCNQLKLKACSFNVIMVNRNDGDMVLISLDKQQQIMVNAFTLISEYIISKIQSKNV